MSALRLVFDRAMKEMETIIAKCPWDNMEFYSKWLTQSYYYVNHSTPLLMLAGARVASQDYKLHLRFIEHTTEEKGHEKMLLNDLKGLNKSIKDCPEFASTAALYQTQYFWIEHQNPISFFGYILFLEGLASTQADYMYKASSDAHGKKGCSFLKVHAGEDPDHIERAFSSLQNLSESSEKMIIANLENSMKLYSTMLANCAEGVRSVKDSTPIRKAA